MLPILVLLFFPASSLPAQLQNGFDISSSLVPKSEILRGGPPRDGIPAIHDPRFEPAEEASFLQPDDRVLGISLEGEARAYPIRILNWHEIVNDQIGSVKLAVTFCPLCGTGMAFSSQVEGKPLRFGVSGLLYNSDVLLYDLETESLWSQIMGKAVTGTMMGKKLTPLQILHTTWKKWQELHPASLVLSEETGFSRNYGKNPYRNYLTSKALYFKVAHKSPEWLHPKELVLGLAHDNLHKAYPFSELEKFGMGSFKDRLGGMHYTVHWDKASQTAYLRDERGKDIPAVQGFWFAWYAFHPQTEVFKAP